MDDLLCDSLSAAGEEASLASLAPLLGMTEQALATYISDHPFFSAFVVPANFPTLGCELASLVGDLDRGLALKLSGGAHSDPDLELALRLSADEAQAVSDHDLALRLSQDGAAGQLTPEEVLRAEALANPHHYECPHCAVVIAIDPGEEACRTVRCGTTRAGQLGQHLSEAEAAAAARTWGCGGQSRLVATGKGLTLQACTGM